MATLTTIPAIETPLLILREIEQRDGEHFSRFMIQPDYQKHIAMKFGDEAEVKAFVTRCLARQGDDRRNVFHLAAEEKLSGEAVGDGFIIAQRAGLHEIGWGVHPAMWASGYGTDIGRALLGLGFERLKAERIWCKIMSENEASIKLARRIGMRHLKSSPDYPSGNGRYEAVEIFAISADEYFDLAY